MEHPQGLAAIRDTDIMRRIEVEAKEKTPFENTEQVLIHKFETFEIINKKKVKKIIQIKSRIGDFNSNILKDASPTAILNILKDKKKIAKYYSLNIANNSSKFTPEKMRETLIRILLIRIIENIIYICSKDIKNVKPPSFEEFITELHSKDVIPLNASNIDKLIKIIDKAIILLDNEETQIGSGKEAILALTIWKFTSKLNDFEKTDTIKPILENIKTTLETEKKYITERIEAPNKISGADSRPGTALRGGTRRAQRGGNKSKSKSNRTRKKH